MINPNKVILDGEQSDAIIAAQAAEIRRLTLTDAEREALLFCYRAALPEAEKLGGNAGELCRIHRDTLRGLLERLG
jgi:hypothetical protein